MLSYQVELLILSSEKKKKKKTRKEKQNKEIKSWSIKMYNSNVRTVAYSLDELFLWKLRLLQLYVSILQKEIMK